MEYTKSAKIETLSLLNEEADGHSPRITILGIGNLLLKDEGVGIHLVQKLSARGIDRENLNIVDGGTSPDIMSLIDHDIDKLIIVDAVKAGNSPGTVYRVDSDNLDLDSATPISLHEIGVLDSLKMMALLNKQPKSTVIVGVEPKAIDYGLELSPEVEAKVPEIVKIILKEIEENTATEVDR